MHPPVKFYPLMILTAALNNFGGAVRLFVMAKNFDKDGRGVIYASRSERHTLWGTG